MNFEAIYSDQLEINKEYPARLEPFAFNSNGHKVNCVLYVAQGEGPHATIILFHGFPGYEKNIDLAQIFRRAGYNVMIFHYRGSWGSEGSYSVSNSLEDADAAIVFLRSKECKRSYRIDSEKIILIGHSLGGFIALMTAANHPEIKLVASLAGFNIGAYGDMIFKNNELFKSAIAEWEDLITPIRGITAEQFIKDAVENREKWNLMNITEKLKCHSVLMTAGNRDDIATVNEHHEALVSALKKHKIDKLQDIVFDADHNFSDKRVSLAKEILYWLLKQ